MTDHSSATYFVIVTRSRPWSPPPGRKSPPGEAWEAMCIPGKVVGCGSSEEEAVSNLESMVQGSCAIHPGGMAGWWSAATRKMTASDTALFTQFFGTFPHISASRLGTAFRSDARAEHQQISSTLFREQEPEALLT